MSDDSNAPSPPAPPLDLVQVELQRLKFDQNKHARDRWHHEDHLVNQRTTWLIQTQGVFGGAFGYLQYRAAEVNSGLVAMMDNALKNGYLEKLGQFARGIQLLGLVTSVALFIGIVAAGEAQKELQKQHPLISLGVTPKTTDWGYYASLAIPGASILAWLISYILIK